MDALYPRSDDALRRATQLADRRCLTKAASLGLASAKDESKRSLHQIAAALRRTSKLRFDPSVVIGKTFYDTLYKGDNFTQTDLC